MFTSTDMTKFLIKFVHNFYILYIWISLDSLIVIGGIISDNAQVLTYSVGPITVSLLLDPSMDGDGHFRGR